MYTQGHRKHKSEANTDWKLVNVRYKMNQQRRIHQRVLKKKKEKIEKEKKKKEKKRTKI